MSDIPASGVVALLLLEGIFRLEGDTLDRGVVVVVIGALCLCLCGLR